MSPSMAGESVSWRNSKASLWKEARWKYRPYRHRRNQERATPRCTCSAGSTLEPGSPGSSCATTCRSLFSAGLWRKPCQNLTARPQLVHHLGTCVVTRHAGSCTRKQLALSALSARSPPLPSHSPRALRGFRAPRAHRGFRAHTALHWRYFSRCRSAMRCRLI